MAWSLTNLGADILLVEQLLEPTLCSHILQITECCEFKQAEIDNLLLASRLDEIAQGIPTRDISIVGYLNEGFEGGETFFDRQNLKVKPQIGSVLVFPSYYTHPHQSLPVLKGKKYSFTTWLFN